MLISPVLPIMSIYRLPHGQYSYSGHVINLPQDIASFANSLPRLPSDVNVLVVRREGSDQSTHHDFRVRRDIVLHALQWLLANNKYYKHITINFSALNSLPEDDNLSSLSSVTLPGVGNSNEMAELQQQEDSYHSQLVSSFVPLVANRSTEQETIEQSIRHSDAPSTVPWPASGENPINEFTNEGYMSSAFPTLFPTGDADFLAPRQHEVTVGYYFKHLMMYEDGRFAKHPRFRFFALNSEMRWRALQTGRIYVRQHPNDAHLSVDELRDMVGREGQQFSNRVLHYAASLRGTRQYWYRQRSRLIAMVDTIGLPTIFFTHSAADIHWPELAHLICPENSDNATARSQALAENPAIADWFFSIRIQKFIEAFYVGILHATDYWVRFEWQHRGSPHVHGLAWLPNAPDVDKIGTGSNTDDEVKQSVVRYVDNLVTTINPGVLPDGTNSASAPPPKTNPHICNKAYSEVDNFQQDLIDLVATCQRHTRCSPAYCLRTIQGEQKCRYGYPKPLQTNTTIIIEEKEPELLTARNDGLVNSYNPLQLSAWRANVDMQYCVSRHKVIEYCAKYATKCEPRSEALAEVFSAIVRGLKDTDSSLKTVQKILIHSVGERDFSAQETCHLLLQLPMFRASRDFIVLSLDGTRAIEENLDESRPATTLSILDHYMMRPALLPFDNITLLMYAQQYTTPKVIGSMPSRRRKDVVVITRPYYSPDPTGPQYDKYCQQKLMLYVPFRNIEELLNGRSTFEDAYVFFLHSRSGTIPRSMLDDIHRLEQSQQSTEENAAEEVCMYIIVTLHITIIYSRYQMRTSSLALETWKSGC